MAASAKTNAAQAAAPFTAHDNGPSAPPPGYVPPQAASTAPQPLPLEGNWLSNYLEAHGFVIPSWTRGIITACVVFGLAVGVAMAGSALAAFFVAGAAALSASAFLAWVAGFTGWCIALYFGGKLIVKAASYILQHRADADLARARDTANHLMTSPPKYAQPVYVVPS